MITYVDTSVVLKLLVDDELGSDAVDRLWLDSDYVVCAEIGYVEARAALAAAHRNARLNTRSYASAKAELESLWSQVDVVVVSTRIIRSAGDLAESDQLRGTTQSTLPPASPPMPRCSRRPTTVFWLRPADMGWPRLTQ